jgi:two-component system chemotaxis response regulator CheB
MPLSVLNTMEVDYCVPISEMGTIIEEITAQPVEPFTQPPQDLVDETNAYVNMTTDIESAKENGSYTPYTCPDCGGVLFKH